MPKETESTIIGGSPKADHLCVLVHGVSPPEMRG